MYHAIVRGRIRALWRGMNRGNYRPILDGLDRRFTYTFAGETPLSGTWHSRTAMEAFFGRLFRLFPDAHFTLHDVLVAGGLWHTRVATWLTIEAQLPDGTAYTNTIMQQIHLRWGKVTRVYTLEDTQKLAGAYTRLATLDVAEAAAPKITDVSVPDAMGSRTA